MRGLFPVLASQTCTVESSLAEAIRAPPGDHSDQSGMAWIDVDILTCLSHPDMDSHVALSCFDITSCRGNVCIIGGPRSSKHLILMPCVSIKRIAFDRYGSSCRA